MLLRRIVASATCAAALLANLGVSQASSITERGNLHPSVSISNNSGGKIASFAVAVARYREAGTLVMFNGRCDSACTLFLGLPARQTCISHGAYFRFHSPSASSMRSEKIAQAYLMRKYPDWVRAWIASKNGLTHKLITMNYNYASQFMQTCNSVASR